MRHHKVALLSCLLLPLLAALVLRAGVAHAAPAQSCAWRTIPAPNPSGNDQVNAIAATSATDAWIVGSYYTSSNDVQTLIEHWNGSSWSQVASPNPGGSAKPSQLSRVVATSSTNAWAVGGYSNGTADQTLIEHWNGTSWSQVASPSPGGRGNENFLDDVSAISSTDAWAVGSFFNGTVNQTLIELMKGTQPVLG